jgi:hypothetical protein
MRDTFENDRDFQELKKRDDRSLDLVNDVVNAAKGVFLWVFLVVRSLLEGLVNSDRLIDLKERLRLIPTDLNEYFERILFTVDNLYRRQTAQIFEVAITAHDRLHLMGYWFVDQRDTGLSERLGTAPVSSDATKGRLKQMRKRLNACCKGLLEVQSIGPVEDPDSFSPEALSNWDLWNVDFLHRTVRDFLRIPDTQKLIKKWTIADFDTDLVICEAMIAIIKVSPQEESQFRTHGPVWKAVDILLHHLTVLEDRSEAIEKEISLIDELDRTLKIQQRAVGEVYEQVLSSWHWLPGQPSGLLKIVNDKPSILHEAVRLGLCRYVSTKLDTQHPPNPQVLNSLLDIALTPIYADENRYLVNLNMVRLLLTKGAKPNAVYGHGTIWSLFLEHLLSNGIPRVIQRDSDFMERSYRVIEELLKHEANVYAFCMVERNGKVEEMNAYLALRKLLTEAQMESLSVSLPKKFKNGIGKEEEEGFGEGKGIVSERRRSKIFRAIFAGKRAKV